MLQELICTCFHGTVMCYLLPQICQTSRAIHKVLLQYCCFLLQVLVVSSLQHLEWTQDIRLLVGFQVPRMFHYLELQNGALE